MNRKNIFQKFRAHFVVLCLLAFLTGCETPRTIVNNVPEREANEIIVFLASHGIHAEKQAASSSGPGGGTDTNLWSIAVDESKMTEAMSILNQNGLPRVRGTTLLQLFEKAGLMSSEKEETIRYQAGLAEQIGNMIRMIDGVIDAQVQLSIPKDESIIPGQKAPEKTTASIYVKHQGILDDPNSHLVTKIKRLVAGSVPGLDVNNVTVVSDRSRFTDITLGEGAQAITPGTKQYVSIWSIVMSKQSAARFRTLFFILSFCAILFAVIIGWLMWKFYPILKKHGGIKQLLHPLPVENGTTSQGDAHSERTHEDETTPYEGDNTRPPPEGRV